MNKPKILVWDIETTPVTAYTWDLYPNMLSHDNIVQDWSIICAAWKWVGEKPVYSEAVKKVHDDKAVCISLSKALTEADIVVGHNIKKFDIKKLKARLAYHKLPPLPKLVVVDTRTLAKEVGGFTSNRLDYLGKFLLGEGKMHVDYQLWLDVMKGSKTAIKKMGSYNKVDVVRNEQVYLRLRPYADRHPHLAVLQDKDKCDCPKCGSTKIQKRGTSITNTGTKYQRIQCQDCGGWHQVSLKQVTK